MTPSKLPLALSVFAIAFFSVGASASAWAPAGSATIHPGVMTFTGGQSFLGGAAQCIANFVYTDASGAFYLGQAAHCSSTGATPKPTDAARTRLRSVPRSTRANSSTA